MLVTKEVNINFTHGFLFITALVPLTLIVMALLWVMILFTPAGYLHYWAVGPFFIIFLAIDIILALARCICKIFKGDDPEDDH